MKKLFALGRAFAIVAVSLLPGFGAAFSIVAAAPHEKPPSATPERRIELVGTWVAMEPGLEEGALRLGLARVTTPLPAGASPSLELP
jgi:hypothetical protein